MNLTLIPEASSYGIAILVIYCLSSFFLAEHIYYRWLAIKGINLMVIYSGVMSLIVVWGFMLFDTRQIFGDSINIWIVSIPLGIIGGRIAGLSDRIIVRYLLRRSLFARNSSNSGMPNSFGRPYRESYHLVRASHFPVTGRQIESRVPRLTRAERYSPTFLENQQLGLTLSIIVAILEELVYRGFLVQACFLLLTPSLIVVALLGSVMIFSFSHLSFGMTHVLAKLPLGLLTILTVLALGTVLPGIIAHVTFNVEVWRDRNNQSIFLGQA